jgi:hypothetical protein
MLIVKDLGPDDILYPRSVNNVQPPPCPPIAEVVFGRRLQIWLSDWLSNGSRA